MSVLKVWELSDLDRDGMLDKDEFSVVRYDLILQKRKETTKVKVIVQLVSTCVVEGGVYLLFFFFVCVFIGCEALCRIFVCMKSVI